MTVQHLRAWVPSDTFATRLVLVRRELGVSVKEAAAQAGLHYATWSTWENGRKPADMAAVVRAISDGLGVDRDWLMWGHTNNAPQPEGPEGVDGSSVRHQGLEPRTRWFTGSRRERRLSLVGAAA
jgi:transcriptional regulator with XRE-family HTH domain